MSLSVENKKFLGVLNQLGVDVKQFPDLTFDGLFENVPEDTNKFFDWFIENVTPQNALSKTEKEIYFQLESFGSLSTEEEMNQVLASCEEVCFDLNSVEKNVVSLSKELDDLKKYKSSLTKKAKETESVYDDIKKKQDSLREEITSKKKLLNNTKQESQDMSSFFGNTVDNVSKFLLEKPHSTSSLNTFNELVAKEKSVVKKLQCSQLMDRNTFICSEVDFLPELSRDVLSVDMSMILSEGFLNVRKAKIDFLSEILQERKCRTIKDHNVLCRNEISEEIKSIELQLLETQKQLSHGEVQKIIDEYLSNKTGLNICYLNKLTEGRDYIKSICKTTTDLKQILLKWMKHTETCQTVKKQLLSKIIEYETNLNNNIINIELRSQRFKEVMLHQDQHPLLVNLGNMSLERVDNNEIALKNIIQLMSSVNDDSNFISNQVQNKVQSLIKIFFDDVLCGPTFQILFTPVELLIKFQECIKRNEELSHMVKQLANNYVDAKEKISMIDRKTVVADEPHKC